MRKLRNRLLRKNDQGFTLIELVVVVVIIGILTAIAIPSYGAIQGRAKMNAVVSAAKDQLSASQAELASGKTVTTGWTQSSLNNQIAVSIQTPDRNKPLSESNIYVQAVWLKKNPEGSLPDSSYWDLRYIRTVAVKDGVSSEYDY